MDTFSGHFQLSTLDDLNRLQRLVAWSLGDILNFVDDVVSFKHFAKDDVAAIEPAGPGSAKTKSKAQAVAPTL